MAERGRFKLRMIGFPKRNACSVDSVRSSCGVFTVFRKHSFCAGMDDKDTDERIDGMRASCVQRFHGIGRRG